MRLGLGSYTFTWAIGVPGHPPARPMSALAFLEEAVRLGVKVVQICDNLPLHTLSPAQLDCFEAKLGQAGLLLELGTRGLEPDRLRIYLRLAQRFHCPFLRLVVDHAGHEPSPAEAVQQLGPLMPDFERAGVRLAIENHDRFPSATLVWMVEQLGRARAGICLDTVNSFGALEGPAHVVETLGPLTLSIHVKDFTVRRPDHQMGFLVEGCAAGRGRLDVPWLLRHMAHGPACCNAILETWVTPCSSLDQTIRRERDWTEAGVRYLRGLIED